MVHAGSGLVILFLFLMIPLLRVLVPSVFTEITRSAHTWTLRTTSITERSFENREDRGHHHLCLYGGGILTAYFISRCDKKWRGLLLCVDLPDDDELRYPKLCMDQYSRKTLIYQRAMSVSDWTGASVIALIMIVVTLVVIKGFNALAARLDRRGEDYA